MPRNESPKVKLSNPELTSRQWQQRMPVRHRRRALKILLQAAADAAEAGRGRHEFAVELAELHRFGVLTSDLRWLVGMGYAKHLTDRRIGKRATLTPRLISSLRFTGDARFVLTDAGLSLALQRCTSRRSSNQTNSVQPALKVREQIKPFWNAELRELWLGNSLVKRFRTKADNQITILAAFHEEGWPGHIDDPLPPNGSSETQRKLHDAINKLNHKQIEPLIRFTGDGTGKGVCWLIDASAT